MRKPRTKAEWAAWLGLSAEERLRRILSSGRKRPRTVKECIESILPGMSYTILVAAKGRRAARKIEGVR